MNTTDNQYAQPENEDEAKLMQQHSETGVDPNQVDSESNPNDLVQTEVSAPISESQVQPGREAVDGNGQRDIPTKEMTRPDTIENPDADTQHKREVSEAEHAKQVEDRQKAKLNTNSKPANPEDTKKKK